MAKHLVGLMDHQQSSHLECHLPPGACIIKLITTVIYGFRNTQECLSLKNRSGWKGLQGQTVYCITETVNYGRNKFYRPQDFIDIIHNDFLNRQTVGELQKIENPREYELSN